MSLFPPLTVNRHFLLPVSHGHQLYVEESGSPRGLPVVVLHGGPGGACVPAMRQFFDPDRFRIICFDQRGAGQSLPHASITDNTTPLLVEDMERLRCHLGIERWLVFGGSWGVTLALAYASMHAARVLGMVLRGVFLCRPQDLHWLYSEQGAARLFPQGWQRLCEAQPPGSDDLLLRYYHGLQGDRARLYARAWCNWEAQLANMTPQPEGEGDAGELAMARLEAHYFVHGGFLERALLDTCRGLAMPVEIVHGERDYVCPPDQAWALHQVLDASAVHWVPDAGHSAFEPAVAEALVSAVKRIEQRVKA